MMSSIAMMKRRRAIPSPTSSQMRYCGRPVPSVAVAGVAVVAAVVVVVAAAVAVAVVVVVLEEVVVVVVVVFVDDGAAALDVAAVVSVAAPADEKFCNTKSFYVVQLP